MTDICAAIVNMTFAVAVIVLLGQRSKLKISAIGGGNYAY